VPHPLPVIAQTALVTQKITSTPELHDMDNVFCVGFAGAPALADIADAMADAYSSTLLTIMSAAVSLGTTLVTLLDGTTPTATFTTDKAGTAGGHGTGNGFPLSIAQGITWQTALRGRSFRGRSYLPGCTDDMFVNARVRTLSNGQFAALQAQATAFIASLVGQTPALALLVLSRKLQEAHTVTFGRANTGGVEQRRRYERVAHH
jgi:hypothetical protein